MNNVKDRILAWISGAAVVAVVILGVQTFVYQQNAKQDACTRTIEVRDDNRIMWTEALKRLPQDDPAVQELYVIMDQRLPPYQPGSCPPVVWSQPDP